MKVRNYEKTALIITTIIILLITEIIIIGSLLLKREYQYQNITGIVEKENQIVMIIDKDERKIVYKNSTMIVDDKKRRYQIIEDKGIIFKRNKKEYYEILINIKINKTYKPQDTIELCIPKKKKSVLKILKKIWEGDKNNTN